MLHVVFLPANSPSDDERLRGILHCALTGIAHKIHPTVDNLPDLRGARILFALPVGEFGVNFEYQKLLLLLRQCGKLLQDAVAGLVVDGSSTLYTKSAASELTLAGNLSGATFVGRPLVEGVYDLENFHIQADNCGKNLEETYCLSVRDLAERVCAFSPQKKARPNLLVLHASSRHVSNSMDLWEEIHHRLGDTMEIEEIGLRNGTLSDCSGCPYTTCLHFGEQGGCFYGGVMSEAVYPAVRRADAILMVCPNYNDAISANLTAFVNRLTALFRQTRFYDKAIYGIVVSGYSGGDIVAKQLISALNMNKSFYLPANFAMIERANSPHEALKQTGIEGRLDTFAQQILCQLCDHSS